MDNRSLAERVVELVGGEKNVASAQNCTTRLRISVVDPNGVDVEALKGVEGVLAVVRSEDDPTYVQVVLGPGRVKDVMAILVDMGISERAAEGVATEDWRENKASVKAAQKRTRLVEAVRVLADIFTPMIPAFIASGICNGVGKIIKMMIASGVIPTSTASAVVMGLFVLVGNAFLAYLAIFTGVQAAKQFKVSPMLGGMIGAASLNDAVNTISTALGWYNEAAVGDSILSTGAGGVIGVIVGVYILAKVEHWVHTRMPYALDTSFTPVISMLVAMPIFVLIVMPATGWLSGVLADFLGFFIASDNVVVSAVTGFVLAACFLPLVLLGLHRGLTPIYTLQIQDLGFTALFPAVAMAGAGQVGAAIALYLKAKRCGNDRLRHIIEGALPAGILGIGEPLIYGVTLPMMKPFVTAGIGAGFGGAFVMVMHVASTAFSPSGILGTSIMLPEFMLLYVIGLVISYVMGAIITYAFIPIEDVKAA